METNISLYVLMYYVHMLIGILSLQVQSVKCESPVVRTSRGDIRGRIIKYQEGVVHQFLAIPYAEPPVGNLRFRKPVASGAWEGELDGTQYGPSCPQIFPYNVLAPIPNTNVSEDCLVLNIYTPVTIDDTTSKAVMVYIHGGGFNSGQGMATDGSLLSLNGNVIVVTINYRLDLLGFLYTGDDSSRGNYGLWDQNMALEWIQENMKYFGGDSNKITVFGASAGAFSIGLHLFSSHSSGLFQRAILQSGSALTKLALAFDPVNFAHNISIQLGCIDDNESEWNMKSVVECLRTKSVDEILTASVTARTHDRVAYRLDVAPVIDGDFITNHPEAIIKKGGERIPFYTTDIISGTNTAEGGNVLYMLNGFSKDLNINARVSVPRNVMCDNITHYLVEDFFNNDNDLTEKICTAYDEIGLSRNEQSMKAVDLVGDMMFVAPEVKMLNYHTQYAKNKATYQYLFSHEPAFNNLKFYFPWFQGTNHLDELPFVFGPKISYSTSTRLIPEERELSEEIMIYWSNFAKTGNPNKIDEYGKYWPMFTLSKREYLNLSLSTTIGSDLWPTRMKFWNLQIPSFSDNEDTTYVYAKSSSNKHFICLLGIYLILSSIVM